MADAFTGSNYYKRSFTEYEVEACKRDAAKRAQGCDECSLTEHEVHSYDQQSETYSHIFTAATAMAAKIERRAELDAEIPALEAEIAAAKTNRTDALAAKDAEITELMVQIAAAKSKRNNKLAAMDAEITALEAELAANRS
jgi:chromosome segregation ATPase